jgi:hypothetical protein
MSSNEEFPAEEAKEKRDEEASGDLTASLVEESAEVMDESIPTEQQESEEENKDDGGVDHRVEDDEKETVTSSEPELVESEEEDATPRIYGDVDVDGDAMDPLLKDESSSAKEEDDVVDTGGVLETADDAEEQPVDDKFEPLLEEVPLEETPDNAASMSIITAIPPVTPEHIQQDVSLSEPPSPLLASSVESVEVDDSSIPRELQSEEENEDDDANDRVGDDEEEAVTSSESLVTNESEEKEDDATPRIDDDDDDDDGDVMDSILNDESSSAKEEDAVVVLETDAKKEEQQVKVSSEPLEEVPLKETPDATSTSNIQQDLPLSEPPSPLHALPTDHLPRSLEECLYGHSPHSHHNYDASETSLVQDDWDYVREQGLWKTMPHEIRLSDLRKIASQRGIPEEGSHRALTWRVLLYYLPTDNTQWGQVLQTRRTLYKDLVQDLFQCPAEDGNTLRWKRKSPGQRQSEIAQDNTHTTEQLLSSPVKRQLHKKGLDLQVLDGIMKNINALQIKVLDTTIDTGDTTTRVKEDSTTTLPLTAKDAQYDDFVDSANLLDEIRKDVDRTFPDSAFFLDPERNLGKRRYAALERILFVW